jgi:hypothetical protein
VYRAFIQVTDLMQLDTAGRVLTAALIVGAGTALLVRAETDLPARAMRASNARPVRSLGAGVIAQGALLLAVVYGGSQLAQLRLGAVTMQSISLGLAAVVMGGVGVVGFAVVATAVAGLLSTPHAGATVGIAAGLAGVVMAVELRLAAVLWVVIVSWGVGGLIRRWFTASAERDAARR